jgi:hypothetical protein
MRAALILGTSLVLSACNMAADAQGDESAASGAATQRSYQLTGFDGVSIGGPYHAIVKVGPAASVRAEGPGKELDRMEVKVEGGKLVVERKEKNRWFGNSDKGDRVTLHVTVPSLSSASIGGSGEMQIDRVEGATFAAAIAGSGDMEIGALRVDTGNFSVAGSGNIWAKGSAGNVKISIAGSGDVNLDGVESRTASVSIAGSGEVRTHAKETADVSIVGSGDVTVSGGAKCSVSKKGSGDVRCGA